MLLWNFNVSKKNWFPYFHTMVGKIMRDKHALCIFFNNPSVVLGQYLCLKQPIAVWLDPLNYVTNWASARGGYKFHFQHFMWEKSLLKKWVKSDLSRKFFLPLYVGPIFVVNWIKVTAETYTQAVRQILLYKYITRYGVCSRDVIKWD